MKFLLKIMLRTEPLSLELSTPAGFKNSLGEFFGERGTIVSGRGPPGIHFVGDVAPPVGCFSISGTGILHWPSK